MLLATLPLALPANVHAPHAAATPLPVMSRQLAHCLPLLYTSSLPGASISSHGNAGHGCRQKVLAVLSMAGCAGHGCRQKALVMLGMAADKKRWLC